MENHLDRELDDSEKKNIHFTLWKFSSNWKKYGRKKASFEKAFSSWLDSEILHGDPTSAVSYYQFLASIRDKTTLLFF